MAKKKKEIEVSADAILGLIEQKKDFEIVKAVIKDDFCNYSFSVLDGVGIGDTHNVTGTGIVLDDMITSFQVFNRHFACIDDVFKHSKVDIENIDTMVNHELCALYSVNGFSIHGSSENESIVLYGSKYLSIGGRIDFKTTRVALDGLSAYRWWNELKIASDNAIKEVELYKGGKYTPVEKEEKANPKQLKITDDMDEVDNSEEFENAKL